MNLTDFIPGGDGRGRTGDILLAGQALSQLSYIPEFWCPRKDSNLRPATYEAAALTI